MRKKPVIIFVLIWCAIALYLSTHFLAAWSSVRGTGVVVGAAQMVAGASMEALPMPKEVPASTRKIEAANVFENPVIVVMCYNRPWYLNDTLKSLVNVSHIERYPVVIAQDGMDDGVKRLSEDFVSVHANWSLLVHPHTIVANASGARYLAEHYKYVLEELVVEREYSHVIIVEDDMIFSPDFLEFFEQTNSLLEEDPTLWCISSWNDNGLDHLAKDPKRLFRTDYFPGLGWLLTGTLWRELRDDWPVQHWDHHLRKEKINKGRECVCPEVSRNFNIGIRGVHSDPAFYEARLARINYNTLPSVDLGNMSYVIEKTYDENVQLQMDMAHTWFHTVEVAPSLSERVGAIPASLGDVEPNQNKTFVLVTNVYKKKFVEGDITDDYAIMSKHFNIWASPRAVHRGVNVLVFEGNTWLIVQDTSPFLTNIKRSPHTDHASSGVVSGE